MSNSNDPLFVGLTRPTMIFGVSTQFALLNMLISVCFYIYSSSIKIILIALIIHGIGYYACFKEPKFVELYMNKFGKFNNCKNKIFYGANSYGI